MPRRGGLILACLVLAVPVLADNLGAIWREYGLVRESASQLGELSVTTYEMKDPTGALAAWEWLRGPQAKTCLLAPFCSAEPGRTIVSDFNYVVVFQGSQPTKAQVDTFLKALPNKHDSSLPAILTFMPRKGLVPASARYILGPASLAAFAPELASAKPGFDSGAEAQVATYYINKSGSPARLALFYYPTPEMARLHSMQFKAIGNTRVKRSSVLVAVVLGFGTLDNVIADTLLSRIEYEAKIIWNETPPPSPIKPLYRLLVDILYLSGLLTVLCLVAGLMYAAMRIYRRRYGTLDSEEAMITLHLTGH